MTLRRAIATLWRGRLDAQQTHALVTILLALSNAAAMPLAALVPDDEEAHCRLCGGWQFLPRDRRLRCPACDEAAPPDLGGVASGGETAV